MIPGRYEKQPTGRVGNLYDGPLAQGILNEMDKELRRLREQLVSAGVISSSGGSGSSGSGSSSAQRDTYIWIANGPYVADTDVDGKRMVERTGTIESVRIVRTTPGTSSSTTLDLNADGTTLYTTQANRPTLTFAQTSAICTQPDVASVAMGAKLTVDADAVEAGEPEGWVLLVDVRAA